jgi:ABC-type bacteriocin/lantibiotic exporter with double-glycine peptidase domain
MNQKTSIGIFSIGTKFYTILCKSFESKEPLVFDEGTASMENTTDVVLQKMIRTKFKHCTVIPIAHHLPTVINCNMVLAMSDCMAL